MQRYAIAALVGCLLGPLPARSSAQTTWLCGLSTDAMRLVCVAETGPRESLEPALRPVAEVNGTRFPLDPHQIYTVELLGPATEMDFVEQLAHSTICYRSPACNVIFITARTEAVTAVRRP